MMLTVQAYSLKRWLSVETIEVEGCSFFIKKSSLTCSFTGCLNGLHISLERALEFLKCPQ